MYNNYEIIEINYIHEFKPCYSNGINIQDVQTRLISINFNKSESWNGSRKFQATWKPSLWLTNLTCGFVNFEKGETCQS